MIPDTLSVYLEKHADDAVNLLIRLCRQPSVAAQNLGTEEMAQLVKALLEETGFTTRFLHADAGPPVVYAELPGTGPFTLLLYNHYDVQPPEPLELWESPPFEPTVRDGKLYARGVADNKGEIATRLAAIRALLAIEGTLPINIRWVLEGEEEISSVHFPQIAERYADLLRADGSFWEGSGFAPHERTGLCLGAKGILYVQLDIQMMTRDAHSGSAPILPSAAWRLVQALTTLRTPEGHILIPGFYDAVCPPSADQHAALVDTPNTEDVTRAIYGIDRFVDNLTGVALRERAAFGPTCNIAGLVSGYTGEGVKTVLPAKASAKIDFRLVPDQDPQEILAQLRTHLDAHGYDDVGITVLGSAAPTVTPITDPFVRRVMAITETYTGKPPVITPISGGSLPLLDALQRFVGVPGLFAPGNPAYWASGAHAPNENIRLDHMQEAVRINCVLFRELGK